MQPPAPPKPLAPSFRLKNDSDLFGLGLEEPGHKDSSEEGNCAGAPTPSCQAPADLALALEQGRGGHRQATTGPQAILSPAHCSPTTPRSPNTSPAAT